MIATIRNVYVLATKLPVVFKILMTVINLAGAKSLGDFLKILGDAVQTIKTETPNPPATPNEQKRLIQRLRERIAARFLGVSDQQIASVSHLGTLIDDQHAQTA